MEEKNRVKPSNLSKSNKPFQADFSTEPKWVTMLANVSHFHYLILKLHKSHPEVVKGNWPNPCSLNFCHPYLQIYDVLARNCNLAQNCWIKLNDDNGEKTAIRLNFSLGSQSATPTPVPLMQTSSICVKGWGK